MRRVRRTLLAYVVWHHINVENISPGYDADLKLDEERITRAPTVNERLNFRLSQDYLEESIFTTSVIHWRLIMPWCIKFSQIYSWTWMHMFAWNRENVHRMVKQCILTSASNFFPELVPRQAAEAERNLKTSHYDGKRKGWDWDKYIILHKKQHAIRESLTDYGCREMNNGSKVATVSKELRAKSWRQHSMLPMFNQRNMEHILTQLCPF